MCDFRIIENYEEYLVSRDGTVYSNKNDKVLKPYINKSRRGETSVILCVGGETKQFKVHTLVARAFPEICGEWFEGAEVDHKDGNPMNNAAENLRVVSHAVNMSNPITRERMRNITEEARHLRSERMKGEKNPAKHMTDEWRKNISKSQVGKTHSEESKKKMSEATKGRYLGAKSSLSKAVARYKDSDRIEYGGMREAERSVSISRATITKLINNGLTDNEGYKWTFI